MRSTKQPAWVQALSLLYLLSPVAIAADPTPVTTSLVVVSANPSSVTFTASRVSDSSKYASLTAPTIITVNGATSTIYQGGFVWVPTPAGANPPPVPTQFVPKTGAANVITITATTGTPPPVVTFTASQIGSLSTLRSTSTVSGSTVFPYGWIWVPVVAAAGAAALPKVLPVIPPEFVPPEVPAEPTPNQPTQQQTQGCTTTRTPTATAWIYYPTNADGEYYTTQTSTNPPSGGQTDCVAATTTVVTSTVTPSPLPTDDILNEIDDDYPYPDDYARVGDGVQQYLNDKYASLGIAYSTPSAPKPTVVCADKTYDQAIPNAAAFFSGLYPSFCADWKSGSSLTKTYSAKDVKKTKRDEGEPRSERLATLRKRTPPPAPLTQDSYPGWSIEFSWTPKNVQSLCSTADYCKSVMQGLVTGCNGYSLADEYKGGSSESDCGKFSYTLKGYPQTKTTCNQPGKNVFENIIYRDDALDSINNFCEANKGKVVNKGDVGIHEKLFAVTWADGCTGKGSFTMDKNECVKLMTASIDSCDTNSVVYKHGGTTVNQATCASMQVHPYNSDTLFNCLKDKQQLQGNVASSLPDKIAKDVISQFCDRNPEDPRVYTLEPDQTMIFGTLSSGDKPWYPYVEYKYNKDGTIVTDRSAKSDYWMALKAFWRPDNAQDGLSCPPKKQYKIHGDRCRQQMSKLLGVESGQCANTGNAAGSFTEISNNGCVQWSMFAIPGGK